MAISLAIPRSSRLRRESYGQRQTELCEQGSRETTARAAVRGFRRAQLSCRSDRHERLFTNGQTATICSPSAWAASMAASASASAIRRPRRAGGTSVCSNTRDWCVRSYVGRKSGLLSRTRIDGRAVVDDPGRHRGKISHGSSGYVGVVACSSRTSASRLSRSREIVATASVRPARMR